ncbi:hypothetical protein FOL47_006457 [Perkinsus chesapeaki]|uniref:N-acetyltransferase domain-containing protein n=1 Tax=Perkinsus chesapeaki TaxID=330153 RepID=A0A7J6MZM5_PERCH|nr:hypothetical protein FOL47_006457 [Perkinsus chesapeaki]
MEKAYAVNIVYRDYKEGDEFVEPNEEFRQCPIKKGLPCYVAVDEDIGATAVVGFIGMTLNYELTPEELLALKKHMLHPSTNAKVNYVDNVEVATSYQGRRIGTTLLKYSLKLGEKATDVLALTLDVWKVNEGAIKLYERLGFIKFMDSISDCITWGSSHASSLTMCFFASSGLFPILQYMVQGLCAMVCLTCPLRARAQVLELCIMQGHLPDFGYSLFAKGHQACSSSVKIGMKVSLVNERVRISVANAMLALSLVAAKVFAVYLSPPTGRDPAHGKLLLGQGDPGIYKHPLYYVHFNSEREYTFTLKSMQVGEEGLTLGRQEEIMLDTGSNNLSIPEIYFDGLLKKIENGASKKAGAKITLSWDPLIKHWVVTCAHRIVLPPLLFWFGTKGDALLTITHVNYIRDSGSMCVLILHKAKGSMWSLPDQTLVG